jgi:hypothetical protein
MKNAAALKRTLAAFDVPFDLRFAYGDEDPFAGHDHKPRQTQSQLKFAPSTGPVRTRENYTIYKYLASMPRCAEVMARERGDRDGKIGTDQPLANTAVFAIHHIDGKAYGALSVLREWGATDMTAIFVGYNPLMEQLYRPELNEIPDDQFRTCIINAMHARNEPLFAEGTYQVVRGFSKFPKGEDLPSDALDAVFASGGARGGAMTFLAAMQCLTVFNFLRTLARARAAKKKVMVFEDGGYLHPIINQAVLSGWTVADLRKEFKAPSDPATDAALPAGFADALSGAFVGTTEYTRNGYNRSVALQEQHGGKLAYPLFSIACSRVKTRLEGDSIAIACILAMQNVLYSVGASDRLRNILIMGARGSIGRFAMQYLATVVDRPSEQLFGCDLKVDWPAPKPGEVPDWATPPDQPIRPCKFEASAFKKFPKEYARSIDLVFGVTGGPTVGHPTIDGDDIADWLENGTRPQLFMASGSTKTSEFTNVLGWLNQMVAAPADGRKVGARKVLSLIPAPIDDALSDAAVEQVLPQVSLPIPRNFGTQFTFVLEPGGPAGSPTTKIIYLMNNTMPVNFMFYGTPAEILDYSYAQLIDITATLARRAPGLKEARVFATDYSVPATQDVWQAMPLAKDYPVPGPSGQSLPGEE